MEPDVSITKTSEQAFRFSRATSRPFTPIRSSLYSLSCANGVEAASAWMEKGLPSSAGGA
jgi:hypothetical protein